MDEACAAVKNLFAQCHKHQQLRHQEKKENNFQHLQKLSVHSEKRIKLYNFRARNFGKESQIS